MPGCGTAHPSSALAWIWIIRISAEFFVYVSRRLWPCTVRDETVRNGASWVTTKIFSLKETAVNSVREVYTFLRLQTDS